jgi:hypothetical protein
MDVRARRLQFANACAVAYAEPLFDGKAEKWLRVAVCVATDVADDFLPPDAQRDGLRALFCFVFAAEALRAGVRASLAT